MMSAHGTTTTTMTKVVRCVFILGSTLLVSSTTEAATGRCDGKCQINMNAGNCTEAVRQNEFHGSCCAVEEINDVCYMVTTEDCYYYQRGTDGTSCNEEGTACVPSYTHWFATSDEPCPESEYPLNPGPPRPPSTSTSVDTSDATSEEESSRPPPAAAVAAPNNRNGKAAAMCDGTCEINMNAGNCTEAVRRYEFHGSCCTVKEVDDVCYMVTTEGCYYYERGTNGMSCSGEGDSQWCVPSYTYWSATSDEACPETEFPLNPPTSASDEESPTPTPVVAATNNRNSKAAAGCNGICEINMNAGNCTEAARRYEFHGSCCALEETNGECYMVTTESCYYYRRGTDGLSCGGEGEFQFCVPAYTVWSSTSNEACPETQFPLNPPPAPTSTTEGSTTSPVEVATADKAKDANDNDKRTANRFGFGGAPPGGFLRDRSNQISLRLQSNLNLLYETGTGSSPSPGAVTIFQEVTGSFFNALFSSTSDPVFAGKNARYSMENVETTYRKDEVHAKFMSHVEMTDTDGTASTSSPKDIQRLMTDHHLLEQYIVSLKTASSEFNNLKKVVIKVIRHGSVRRR